MNPRENEEPRVVGEQPQIAGALLGTPADPLANNYRKGKTESREK
jgi:hypothetical protein